MSYDIIESLATRQKEDEEKARKEAATKALHAAYRRQIALACAPISIAIINTWTQRTRLSMSSSWGTIGVISLMAKRFKNESGGPAVVEIGHERHRIEDGETLSVLAS